jgi:hypothetical protein
VWKKETAWFCRNFRLQTSKIITSGDLCSQSIKLLCWRSGHGSGGFQLSLANGLPDFNTGDGTTGRPKRFTAQHRVREAFDRSMVLLHEVVEIFGVPDDDGRLVDLIVVRDSGSVAATLINGDLFGQPLVANGFA